MCWLWWVIWCKFVINLPWYPSGYFSIGVLKYSINNAVHISENRMEIWCTCLWWFSLSVFLCWSLRVLTCLWQCRSRRGGGAVASGGKVRHARCPGHWSVGSGWGPGWWGCGSGKLPIPGSRHWSLAARTETSAGALGNAAPAHTNKDQNRTL